MDNFQDPIAEAADKPSLEVLMDEWKRASWQGLDGARINGLDDIRYARWQGQTDDGKKHSEYRSNGEPAWPFEGASDVRCRLADSVCNEISALLLSAFNRADIRGNATEFNDLPMAQATTTLLKWVKENKLASDLAREAELGAQYATQYGWTVFFTGWEQRVSTRKQFIKFDEMLANAQQLDPASPLAALPELVANPEAEDQAAELFMGLLPIDKVEAKELVRDLRKEGIGDYEQQYVSKNLPMVLALKPYDEIALPPETVDLQSARVIFRRCWHTEVELREKVITDDWDEDWVENVVKAGGWQMSANMSDYETASTLVAYKSIDRKNLIEVVYAYYRTIDEGKPAIYYSVFCPSTAATARDAAKFAKHELLDYAHGDYPFVEFRLERTKRAVTDSRGVPELVTTDQDEMKAQHDSLRDRTAFETLPPIKVVKRIGQPTKIGPGVPLPVTRPDDYTFMDPPSRAPQTAFSLLERIETNVASYFGLNHPNVPPVKSQMLQQVRVNAWLGCWQQVFKQMLALCLQYMSPEEIERVTGVPLAQNLTDVAGSFDVSVRFDVRELDTNYVAEKLASIQKFVVPLDAGGVIDRNKLVTMFLNAIVPESAADLVLDQGQASEQMYRQVQSDIGLMMLGSEALYTENDPAAKAKMQMVQDVMSKNPKAQAALQQDQLFQALFENYTKNLQMSIMQSQNASIGRMGVAPIAPQLQEAQQMQLEQGQA